MNKYSDKIVSLGEIMLRLTPPDYTRIEQATSFLANYGGGEANVIVSLSHLGHNCYYITRLPPNQLGDGAIDYLRSHGVNTDNIARGSSTMGIYFLESGFGGRPGRVIYNRKHSSFTRIDKKDYDLKNIFKDATWFHISGITLALGEKARDMVFACLKAAKKNHVKISFDFNYRSTLWSIDEAREVYPQVMPYVDVIFASPWDFREVLQVGKDIKDDDELMQYAISKYHLEWIFGKTRKIFSSTENAMHSYVYGPNNIYYRSEEYKFQIFDRIGAGDAFASGVIHGLLTKPDDPKYAAEIGIVNSILKQTIFGDVATFKEEELIEYLNTQGRSEVKR